MPNWAFRDFRAQTYIFLERRSSRFLEDVLSPLADFWKYFRKFPHTHIICRDALSLSHKSGRGGARKEVRQRARRSARAPQACHQPRGTHAKTVRACERAAACGAGAPRLLRPLEHEARPTRFSDNCIYYTSMVHPRTPRARIQRCSAGPMLGCCCSYVGLLFSRPSVVIVEEG